MNPYGMPGLGGSLGECALCGSPVITEILLGKKVTSFTIPGVERTLYGHDKCIEKYDGTDVAELPQESELRKAYERSKTKTEWVQG